MHTKFERLLSKSLTTLEVVTYYLVVHTGPDPYLRRAYCWDVKQTSQQQQIRGLFTVKGMAVFYFSHSV